ncbi:MULTISPECIES: N-acetylmuramoyl-L-alanine amidase CwlD [Bacillaceae]|uniref:N-acetylmuramoyl-L-alanine amidase CwlD n=1 Tax=Bacillaceae TaxID=186817 RepID=UPI001E4581F0|nr:MULTISPECIES: N-acetylmuramoyl-L-alanine amidase CwlD [Bacillaceae]MCE4051782.1 N-acetylmuramoyl-L-alanine amidase CwlD [Bacillus sp. Au-Bac7]MCM3034168.1 N-acetylmuramoyl-L-alanine amidase CwlD [Niallia sp. MER 6]MDL0437158.1 N-acetylmuramoyl-L-alanine amidase CwlD [Niallia sp. SS-2023]UPO87823.1 N-acetylmuramoyl-L-alanine amidase CwlD [Niallia sp. Man26]
MNKKLKISIFAVGLILLFFILQFDFSDDDSWDAWNLPLTGKIIVIDPGHGGPDGGAGDEEVLEKDVALDVSLKIRDYLQEQGALVIMTREEDKDLAGDDVKGYRNRKVADLKERLNMINSSDADLFLSIHLNAIPSSKWSGAQTFFSPQLEDNEIAAKFIQDELIDNLENTTRKAKPLNSVYILKYAKKPGALVEIGFLSNPAEKKNLMDKEYQNKIAASIYKGVNRYFSNEDAIKGE